MELDAERSIHQAHIFYFIFSFSQYSCITFPFDKKEHVTNSNKNCTKILEKCHTFMIC